MDRWRHDIVQGWRALRAHKMLTVIALASLALGIGANTAIFSLVHRTLLQPLPYPAADRLVVARTLLPRLAAQYPSLPVNGRTYLAWRAQPGGVEAMAAVHGDGFTLTGRGTPEPIEVVHATASLWPLLGATPALGRLPVDADDTPGRDRIVLLTDAFWRRQFNADPRAVGATLTLDGVPYEVVGVLPASFRFPTRQQLGPLTSLGDRVDAFMPFAFTEQQRRSTADFDFGVIARLAPGVPREAAEAGLERVLAEHYPPSGNFPAHAQLLPLHDQIVRDSRSALWVLLASVGAVLLIVCLNLSNLLVARAVGRARESAIRAALGADPYRLIRQALIESSLLSLAGGALGVLLAWVCLANLTRFAPVDLPRLDEVALDPRAIAFAVGLSLLCGLAAGALPALRLSRAEPLDALKAGSQTTTGGRHGLRTRAALIAIEVGASVVLLTVAALLGMSLLRVLHVEKGFETRSVIAADVALPTARYPTPAARTQFFQRLLERTATLPGLAAAGVTTRLPLLGETSVNTIAPAGIAPGDTSPTANFRYISAGYFSAIGIALRAGRVFETGDADRRVAILPESTARKLWPRESAIGKRFHRGDPAEAIEVIGTVADVRNELDRDPILMVYQPYESRGPGFASLVLRASGDPAALFGAVRGAIQAIDPELAIDDIRTLDALVAASAAPRRFHLTILIVFGVSALLLASLGIYGVVSYAAEQRRRELSLRMALGASAWTARGLVIRQGLRPVLAGLAAGVVGAIGVGRWLESLLFQVRPADPLILIAVCATLVLVSLAASLVPALRATRGSLTTALRAS